MKYLLLFLLIPFVSRADDTAALQAACAAGNFTLTRNYSISGTIPVIYQLHGAGYTINTSQTSGSALRVTSSGAGIDHVTIAGTWAYTSSPNPSGNSGIVVNAGSNNVTITYCHITNVSGYGILIQSVSHLSITHNLIEKVGYIGFYFDAETNTSTTNTFSNNTVDKSMLNPALVTQLAVGIRGSTSNPADITTGWTIVSDTLKMALNTTSTTECIEIRFMKGSTISGLICTGASLGISGIGSTYINYNNNNISGNTQYGLEIGNNQHSVTNGNVIVETAAVGLILDGGATPCYLDTLNNDHITTTGHIALQLFTNTHTIQINNPAVVHTTQGIYCTNADSITIYHASIDGGSHPSTIGIAVNGGHGNILIQRGGITHNTYAVYAINSGVGQLVDYIIGISVNLTGTPTQFGHSFSNGAHYGVNVYFVAGSMVFGSISSHVYGDPNFSPGATSALPITYVSANTAIATIVSGNIHIVHVGTVNITASNGDTSAVQPVTISKAMLTITADNKRKAYRAINPSLTVSFSGWKYGETNSVLTTQPTPTTTALTLSPPGNYPIAVSGAVANNYNFTYGSGLLTITPGSSGHGPVGRLKGKLK